MFEDIVFNPEPSYGTMVLSWAMTSISAKLMGVVVGYIKAKTPVQKTLMDFITIFSLRLILGACLASSVVVSIMTFLSDSGHTAAFILGWLLAFLAQTVRLTAIATVVLQLLFTLHPWLLESSAFESTGRVIVAVVVPTISFVTILAIGYFGYGPPHGMLYTLLRGQDISLVDRLSTPVFVSISLVMISSASAYVFIRMRDPSGNGPNYIFRLDVFALVSLQNMISNL